MCFDIRVVTCGPNEALVISGKICFHEKSQKYPLLTLELSHVLTS